MKGIKHTYSNADLNGSLIGIYGAGGFARELMPLAAAYAAGISGDQEKPRLVFIDDNKQQDEVNGYKVLSLEEYLATECDKRYFNIGVGESKTRQHLAEKCMAQGALPIALVASSTTILDANELSSGPVLCGNVMLTSNASIGKFFQANIYSYVAHDCRIGDYVTFAPRVSCNGNVHIEDHAYIGTGAILKQGTPEKPLVIGEGAVVGMGAVVTKDVAPYTTVVGNPARPFERKS